MSWMNNFSYIASKAAVHMPSRHLVSEVALREGEFSRRFAARHQPHGHQSDAPTAAGEMAIARSTLAVPAPLRDRSPLNLVPIELYGNNLNEVAKTEDVADVSGVKPSGRASNVR